MLRRERPEAARSLRELALAARVVPTPGVVPGDGNVYETLKEVFLGGLSRTPGVLERLMRLEVLAAPDPLEAVPQPLVHRRECYPRSGVATILLAGVDLFIRGKLEATLQGHRFVTSESLDPPDLVIADISRTDPEEVADSYPDIPILGFTNHTDTAGLRRGHEAGFDQVVAKSALTERAPELVEELIA